jgi:hypothetical protein
MDPPKRKEQREERAKPAKKTRLGISTKPGSILKSGCQDWS